MPKYKVCPACGTHNEPMMLECLNCETDLSSTRVIDEETEKAQSEKNIPDNMASSTSKMIRLCDCGHKNPVQNRKCQNCGEDISIIIPTADEDRNEILKYTLCTLDGSYAYEIVSSPTIVGRENSLREYLEKKPFVSRKHAEFRIIEGKLFIINYSHTNFTYINNVKIDDEKPVELKDGDEIGLGGNLQNGQRQEKAAYFVVRIGTCI